MRNSSGLSPDESALKIPVGDISFTEVAIGDLPLFIVITSQVFDVDLPVKEFPGEEEFEAYLHRYAREKFTDPVKREKFIKKHLNNALYMDDEIKGDTAWQFNGEVHFQNARRCGFGILKTQSKQFYMFQTSLGIDLPSQFAAYQTLTYGKVEEKYLPLFVTGEGRERLMLMIGEDVYVPVLEALGLAGLAGIKETR